MLPSLGQGQIFFTSPKRRSASLPTEKWQGQKLSPSKVSTPGQFKVRMVNGSQRRSVRWQPGDHLLDAKTGKVGRRLTSLGHRYESKLVTGRKATGLRERSTRMPQIWVMSLAGGEPRRLTFQGDYNTTPAWSPKGIPSPLPHATSVMVSIFARSQWQTAR